MNRYHFDDEPWGPGVSAVIAATNVVALHIAQALLDGTPEVRTWARELAYELKGERFDLFDEIGAHMQRIALRKPLDEPPF